MRRTVIVLLAGCALTSKASPRELRYFAPPSHEPAGKQSATAAGAPVRLGRIVATSLLRTRILHRDSEVEVAPYATLRWTDEPEVYVRRALGRALFDSHGLEQATDPRAPTLDIDVLAFEETRHGLKRAGRVELRYQLYDEQRVIAHGTVAIERDAAQGIEGVVAAIGGALDAVSAEIASRVAAVIGVAPSPQPE